MTGSVFARTRSKGQSAARVIGLALAAHAVSATAVTGQTATPAAATTSVAAAPQAPVLRSWIANRTAIEQALREQAVASMNEIPIGITRPMRATLVPGGLVAEMAWKPLTPGKYNGYFESYKNEIAAYELDKALALDMVPPTVERSIKSARGAAILWVAPARSFKDLGGAPTPPPAYAFEWARQLSRAKMFDNLIANIDPNLGNWLVDPSWNLVLIDHTRSFTITQTLIHKMIYVDRDLWKRMQALSEENLGPVLGPWMGKSEVKALLARREKMAKAIDELVRTRGPSVYIP